MTTNIDHYAEAVRLGGVAQARNPRPGNAEDWLALAQFKATLALVEAQREANEQARIANLIALESHEVQNDIQTSTTRVYTGYGDVRDDIKEGLGIA